MFFLAFLKTIQATAFRNFSEIQNAFTDIAYSDYSGSEVLDLSNQKNAKLVLSKLPVMKNILTFRAVNSNLVSLPECLCFFKRLRNVDLSNNSITHLPLLFGNLEKLENLNLSINKLSALPPTFSNLKKLKNLNLSKNSLTFIPNNFKKLKRLEYLDLSKNDLRVLPYSIFKIRGLRWIDIRGNPNFQKDSTAEGVGLEEIKRILKNNPNLSIIR